MSALSQDPALMMAVIAKLVHKLGGDVTVTNQDPPDGKVNLRSEVNRGAGWVRLTLPPPAPTPLPEREEPKADE